MNASLQINTTFQKQMHRFGLAGSLEAFSNVTTFLIRELRYFRVCTGKCVLPRYIGTLRFLLLFSSSAVPGLVALAGWSVSTHSQMLAHIYSSLASSLPDSTNTHLVPTTCQAWLYIPRKGRITYFWLFSSQPPELILVICFVSVSLSLFSLVYCLFSILAPYCSSLRAAC